MLYGRKSGAPPLIEPLLSWEWYQVYSLRNHLYPLFISMPGQILKHLPLGSNSQMIIYNSMYAMHTLVIALGDLYLFKLAKHLAGLECAVIALMNHLLNENVVRFTCRTSMNGIEGSLAIIALYYFYQIPPKIKIFDRNLNLLVFFISICFISRSSSIVPWIPLAVLKICENC
jgi:hypothetical protein